MNEIFKPTKLATELNGYLHQQDLYSKYINIAKDWQLMFDNKDYDQTSKTINDMYKSSL